MELLISVAILGMLAALVITALASQYTINVDVLLLYVCIGVALVAVITVLTARRKRRKKLHRLSKIFKNNIF